jgi:hypothetical protein
VLQRLGDHIAECLARAAAAEDRAASATDPELKADHLAIAERWRYLAQSYEFAERLRRFLLHAERHRNRA